MSMPALGRALQRASQLHGLAGDSSEARPNHEVDRDAGECQEEEQQQHDDEDDEEEEEEEGEEACTVAWVVCALCMARPSQ